MELLETLAGLVGLGVEELLAIVLVMVGLIGVWFGAKLILHIALRLFIIGLVVIGGLVVGLYVFFIVLGG